MSTFRGFARGNIHAPAHRFAVLSSASAYPAAGTISDKGRSQRRSVKNRRPFDCFKSAEGIRFSEVARTTPKSFHRGGFWRNLLTSKGCIEKRKCSSKNCAGRSLGSRRPAVVRECSHANPRRPRPEYRCAFCKTGVTPARSLPRSRAKDMSTRTREENPPTRAWRV